MIKKGFFLDLWGHYLEPACSKERVRKRSMSTLNNISASISMVFFFQTFMTYWVILAHFPDSPKLGFYVTKLHDLSKFTTFLFLGRFA